MEKQRIKMLIVEDDRVDQMAFERLVKNEGLSYDYTIAGSISEAKQALSGSCFDIVILDYMLGDGNAFDLFDFVIRTPIIIATGTGDEEIAVRAMKMGAYDYITKDPAYRHLTLLPTAVGNAITRKKMEEQLKEYTEHLEEKVKERTLELEEAKRQTEALARVKTEFIANMSHELLTPLNHIIGFSEVLQDGFYGKVSEKQELYLKTIHQSGKNLFRLISELMEMAKAESDRIEFESKRILLKNVLETSMALFIEKASKQRINLTLNFDPEADLEIEADEKKMKQILFNLLSNAMKFTPDSGSVCVSARLTRDEGRWTRDDGLSVVLANEVSGRPSYIEISVADTGIGIKPEDMPRLFKEFSQLESVYTKTYQGTGVGLALTKKWVELHGGRIWAESELGKGSKFSFVIPVLQSK